MPLDMDQIKIRCDDMVSRDRERDELFVEYEKHDRLEWEKPENLPDYFVESIVTDPQDALRTAQNILTSKEHEIKYQPKQGNLADIDAAELYEQHLAWHFHQADRHGASSIYKDLAKSVLLFDVGCVQVLHIPHQKKSLKKAGVNIKGMFSAVRGDFVMIAHNPRTVHWAESPYGLQAVCVETEMAVSEVIDMWGDLAGDLKENYDAEKGKKGEFTTVIVRNYWDRTDQAVYVSYTANTSGKNVEAATTTILPPTPHKMDFFPWIIKAGGTKLDSNRAQQFRPLLYAVVKSKAWGQANFVESWGITKLVKNLAAAEVEIEGTNPGGVKDDYNHLTNRRVVPLGTKVKDLPPRPVDPNIVRATERFVSKVAHSTLPRMMTSGDYPAGADFSSLNLMMQNGVINIARYQSLIETILEELHTVVLLYISMSGVSSKAFVRDSTSESYGSPLVLAHDEIPEQKDIYISVKLHADIPMDNLQRTNIAQMQHNLGRPKLAVLQGLGISNANQEMAAAMEEKFEDLYIQTELEKIQAFTQMDIEDERNRRSFAMQMEQQEQVSAMESARAAEAEEAAGAAEPPAPPGLEIGAAEQTGGFGGDNLSGGGNPEEDPALGGIPFIQANPGDTRTGREGADRAGNPLAAV